jgi:two-component system, cell cycle sensor histidine kinase and response regulator CckA
MSNESLKKDGTLNLEGSEPPTTQSNILFEIVVNPDGSHHFTFVSDGIEPIHGITPEQLYRDPEMLFRQVYEEDLPCVRQDWLTAIQTRTPFSVELRFRTPQGITRWARLHAALRRKENGSLIWIGMEIDITERKQAEEARRESDLFLQQVIDNAPFGAHFYRLEEDGRLILVKANKTADRILDFDNGIFLGKPIESVVPGLVDTKIPSIFKEIARNGSEYVQEQVDYQEEGKQSVFEINAFQTVPNNMAVFFVEISEQKLMEKALVVEADRRRNLFEQSPEGVLSIDPETGRFLDFNTTAHKQLGYTREEFAGLSLYDIEAIETQGETKARHFGNWDFETLHRTKSGEIRNVQVRAHALNMMGRNIYQSIWRDITENKRAEEEKKKLQAQLIQAQKMESVGRLAGGVAHDFNNMLGVIIGHTELAMDQLSPDHPIHIDLEEIRRAAQHSADLTRQLLAFARKQTIMPRVLNLNDAIPKALKMLPRIIGEDIDLIWIPGKDVHPVRIDPVQLDQILTNLCVNARDAISGMGKITIETMNRTITEKDHDVAAYIIPGQYVLLILRDDGSGMSGEVLSHLFEPFYTTKEVGRGAGLGLATSYGIVKQNNGYICASSELEKGTSFTIYLPSAYLQYEEASASDIKKPWQCNGETVLIVEDEPSLLRLGQSILQKIGFTVLTAATPGEALKQADEHRGNIDLLITDVVLPGMNGWDLAAQITSHNPGLKCLFMSGYPADAIASKGMLQEGLHFLQKPFSLSEFSEKIREMLD